MVDAARPQPTAEHTHLLFDVLRYTRRRRRDQRSISCANAPRPPANIKQDDGGIFGTWLTKIPLTTTWCGIRHT